MTKVNHVASYLVSLCFLTMLISCSNIPKDETIKKIIIDYEKENLKFSNPLYIKSHIYSPCIAGECIEVPKTFSDLNFIENPKENNEVFKTAKRVLDQLSVNKVIYMQKVFDSTLYNVAHLLMNRKDYKISVTEDSKSILVGETGDSYFFSLFKLDDITLINKQKLPDDKIEVKYKLTYSKVFDALHLVCNGKDEKSLIGDKRKQEIIYENNQWNLVKGNDFMLFEK